MADGWLARLEGLGELLWPLVVGGCRVMAVVGIRQGAQTLGTVAVVWTTRGPTSLGSRKWRSTYSVRRRFWQDVAAIQCSAHRMSIPRGGCSVARVQRICWNGGVIPNDVERQSASQPVSLLTRVSPCRVMGLVE